MYMYKPIPSMISVHPEVSIEGPHSTTHAHVSRGTLLQYQPNRLQTAFIRAARYTKCYRTVDLQIISFNVDSF